MLEVSPEENRYIGLMRGLDEFSRDAFDVEVIDQDFAPKLDSSWPEQHSLYGFRRELARLHDELPDGKTETEFMRRNISSTISYIGSIARLSSTVSPTAEDQSYPDYVADVMGVKPERTPEKSLAQQRKDINSNLHKIGYHYEAEDRERFHEDNCIKDMPAAVDGLIASAKQGLAAAAGNSVMAELGEPDITVVNDKSPWQGYFSTDENGNFFIKVNSNPLIKISPVEAEITLAHELGHWMSSSIKEKLISSSELSPAAGLLLFGSHAYFQEEAIARAIEEYAITSQNSGLAEYVRAELPYKNAVSVNMMVDANSGKSEQEVIEYGLDRLPYEDPDKIKAEVDEYKQNVVFRTVFPVDSEALRLGQQIARQPDDQRQATISGLCENTFSAAELAMAIRLGE